MPRPAPIKIDVSIDAYAGASPGATVVEETRSDRERQPEHVFPASPIKDRKTPVTWAPKRKPKSAR